MAHSAESADVLVINWASEDQLKAGHWRSYAKKIIEHRPYN
jgi:hypothetical protein